MKHTKLQDTINSHKVDNHNTRNQTTISSQNTQYNQLHHDQNRSKTQTRRGLLIKHYIPPRQTTDPDHTTEDTDITNTLHYLDTLTNNIITRDFNTYSTTWYSNMNDHRGILIADIIHNFSQITLNTKTTATC